jgi:CheY-like chemotaxis protein
MVVDDSRAIQAIISRLIEDCGYPEFEIERANNGEEALALIPRFTPQLLITDWHMPRVSGLELLQTLRQLGQSHVKVGFVTTESSPTLLEQARTNGAVFVLIESIRAAVPPPPGARTSAPAKAPAPAAVAADLPAVASRAAPDAEPAAAPGERPLPLDHARGIIEHTLGAQSFDLLPYEPMEVARLGANNLLGLYSAPGKAAAAVGVLDAQAVCLIGGGAARLSAGDIAAAQVAAQPSEAMVAQATTFMRAAGMLLQVADATDGCSLTRSMLVPAAFPKLQEVLTRGGDRVDYRLVVPGVGEGRLSFLTL